MIRTQYLATLAIAIIIVTLTFFIVQPTNLSSLWPIYTMTVTHTVLFQFKASANPDDVKAACARFLGLKANCIHPMSKSPYIKSLKGGQDNSIEGLQNGITHGFVVEFGSVEDRQYYVRTDPAHLEFVKSIGDLVEKAIVVDFTDGVF